MILIPMAALAQAASPATAVVAPIGRGRLDSYISADDFPQGIASTAARPVEVALVVGRDGRVTSCTIVATSGTSQLDAATCRLLRSRSRFTPARDSAGGLTSGEVRGTIDWPAIRSDAPRPAIGAPPLVRTTSQPPVITVPIAPPSPEVGAAGARARTNLAALVSSADYPPDAIRAGEQGTTGFRLNVGADGTVAGCSIVLSSGSATLDSATCRLMTSRARFTPALDPTGKPVGDTVTARIAWRLPRRNITVPDLLLARFAIGSDNQARNCIRFIESIGRTQEEKLPDCGPRPPAEPLVSALRAAGGPGELRVRFEARLIRDAAKPWPSLEKPGLKVVGFDLVRLRVGPGGRVLGCTVLDQQSGGLPPSNPCQPNMQVDGYTAPQEAEMRIVAFTALESAG